MDRCSWRVLSLVFASVGIGLPLSGQSVASVEPWAAHPTVPAASAGEVRVALPSETTSGRARGRGALWGAGIGLVAGGILGGLSVGSDDSDDGFGGTLVDAAATGEAVILGALLGAGVGAILGATVFAPSSGSAFEVAPGLSIRPVASFERLGTVIRLRR